VSKKKGKRAIPVRSKIGGGSSKAQIQRLQDDFTRMQEELGEQTATVSVGGGVVEVVITGNQEIKGLHLAPEVIDPEDIEMLQDLIVAAVNEALSKSKEMMAQRLSSMAGGMGLGDIL